MKKTLILTILLASVSVLGFSQTTFAVRNAATWIEAVNGIRNGGNSQVYTITVTGTVSVPPTPSAENTFGIVTGVTVTIEGSSTLSPSANGSLLVIGKDQTIITKDLTMKGRDANNASLVQISEGGTFRMEGKASVTGNKTNSPGSGVYNQGTFTMLDSASVTDNKNDDYGSGVYVSKEGTFTMQGNASVSGNTNGGVYVSKGGTFTMQDSTSVSGNTIIGGGGSGGGVNNSGTFTMKDKASVSGNTAAAVHVLSYGGGVYNQGTFIMQDSASVSGNTAARNDGGGVRVSEGGTFIMRGNASVTGNTSNGQGGGVYILDSTFTMQDSASVSGNTSNASGGGGVNNGGTFTMRDSASVSGNTAKNDHGGGVYNWNTFTMQDNASVSGNTANNGGGVFVYYAFYQTVTFTMRDSASVSGNTAGNGGGVYVEGIFTIQDSASVSGNTADNGGGVYVVGTFTKIGGTIYGDDADQSVKNTATSGKGYAVYESKNDGWRNATAGKTINPGSYGFWLNEDAVVVGFPFRFIGTWKRSNFNNTLAFTATTVKSSSRDVTWKFISTSGNSYTLEANTAAKTRLTLTIKLDRSSIIISGDSGNGENNWNGTWGRQN